MEKDLRKKLGIDDWLELVKEDRNCNGAYISFGQYMYLLEKENQDLKKQLEEVEFIVGLRQKRNLISKFDKEYDEEDKKKNPNRDYAGIMPDAEEIYKRYYAMKNQQKEYIEQLKKLACQDMVSSDFANGCKVAYGIALNRYKEIIGVKDE